VIFLLVGPSFCGKTHLAREYLLPQLLRAPRELTPAAPEQFRGVLIDDPPSDLDPGGQFPGVRYLDVAAWRASAHKSRVSCFEAADTRALLQLSLELKRVILVLDEIDLRLSSRQRLPPEADLIAQRGRHSGIALIGSTRRLHNVHPSVRANVAIAWFGNLSEPRDRAYAAAMADVDEQRLQNLPPRVFLEHNRGAGIVRLVQLEQRGEAWELVQLEQLDAPAAA
jgi:hypothetical protein